MVEFRKIWLRRRICMKTHRKIPLFLASLWATLSPVLHAETPETIDQTQSHYEKALSSDPKDKEAMFVLGLIYEKKGQKDKALQMWRGYQAAETDPHQREIAQKHIH